VDWLKDCIFVALSGVKAGLESRSRVDWWSMCGRVEVELEGGFGVVLVGIVSLKAGPVEDE